MSNETNSTATCIVGCKLPHGLKLELRLENGAINPDAGSHTLKGTNAARIIGGYGLTEGVPMDFMNEWFKQNGKHPAVINGSVFMHTSEKGARARAVEYRESRTGLEGINPIKDERVRGLTLDAEAQANYRKQVAENPARGRQHVE